MIAQRFVEAGFEDTGKGKQHPQPVMQILLDEKQVAKVNVCRVCSAPKGYANWTLRLLTRRGLELFFSLTHDAYILAEQASKYA